MPIITAETSRDTDITYGRKNKGMHLNLQPTNILHYPAKEDYSLDENKVANGLLRWHSCKESTYTRGDARDMSILKLGRCPGLGNGNTL